MILNYVRNCELNIFKKFPDLIFELSDKYTNCFNIIFLIKYYYLNHKV
jgi:hypothetical protein